MNPKIYVITYHKFNHCPDYHKNAKPLDERFLKSDDRYIYYLIDKEVPAPLKDKPVILENKLSETFHEAGGKYFGEWSFLLAEEQVAFCEYPFFMISSRFYEKNNWLHKDLNQEWDSLFGHFNHFRWGYLPSYDRPLRWIDLSWEKDFKNQAWNYKFFPFTDKTYELIEELYGINIPRDYQFTADLFCNYIGFKSRDELLEYTAFYRPIIDYFFDANYQPKRDISKYVRTTGGFRNEKSFTFILELICHLFFFQKKQRYFALHYNGYYSIDEANKKMDRLKRFRLPLFKYANRLLRWQYRRMKTEGFLAPIQTLLKK
ncbi:MAG: hypothetical protein COT85_07000 [Chlamydiae bacterium CG10_big_fil_rev_8_21_14_0_10_42_34]|nr:MAG: hypothetical protein COT85_07000 [Chlamydiae bacterium CG10_big_fil_rev_8_21_14_0_10_42_34]